MRLGHEPGAKTQFDVIDPIPVCIFHILISDPLDGIVIHHYADQPLEFGNKGHHPRLGAGHLHVRTQALQIPGWQRQVMFAAQV